MRVDIWELSWLEFWLAVEAWNAEKTDELERLRLLGSWVYNSHPRGRNSKGVSPRQLLPLDTDPVPRGVNLAEIKDQFKRDQELLKNKGKPIEEFKDADS